VSLPAPLAARPARERATLRRRLDRLYLDFDRRYLETDPLALVHPYEGDADREIAGFIAAGLAFGNVRAIKASVSAVLAALGPSPSAFVDNLEDVRVGAARPGFEDQAHKSGDEVSRCRQEKEAHEGNPANSIGGVAVNGPPRRGGPRNRTRAVEPNDSLPTGLARNEHRGRSQAGSAAALTDLYHRWIRSEDIVRTLGVLGLMRRRSGTIGGFFLEGYEPGDADIGRSLASFSERAKALAAPLAGGGAVDRFFPSPRDGSACKRLNLYLRWMVRDGDGLDLGIWKSVSRRQLVLPLDTHLVRLSRALGLSARRSPGWAMAVEATRSLALLDPGDPVKYDFALSRLGILDRCLHGRDPLECRRCAPPRPSVRRR
jgi:uncharacterized protein (TIGR02757 family)